MAIVAFRPEPPTRRAAISMAERQKLLRHLRLFFAWRDGGRGDPPWLRSGVARATRFDLPRVRSSAPGSRAPVAANMDEDTDGWYQHLDRLVAQLQRDDPMQALLLSMKAADANGAEGCKLTNATIADRLCMTERAVITTWGQLAVSLVNELWPGSSSGFAR